jgi:hypothetical protein
MDCSNEHDSEDECTNYMASLDISDESQVSAFLIDTHAFKLCFQWKPAPVSNKAEDFSPNVELEVEPARPWPGGSQPLHPKYFATHYPVTPLDSIYKEQYFWGKVRRYLYLRWRVKKFCPVKFSAGFPTARTQATSSTSLR